MKRAAMLLMLASVWLLCSCQMVAPVILQSPNVAEKKTETVIPFKLGVENITKKGKADISNTSFTMMGIITFKAKMPRKDERDYVTQSIADHMNDNSLFKVSYVAPFNPQNVDATIRFEFEEYELSNNKFYANFINLPLINLLAVLGAPQDRFSSAINVKISLLKKDGKLIKSYNYKSEDSEWVSLYSQPYANYMWYESVFQKEFDGMMKSLYGKIKTDKAEIAKAIKE